MTLFSSYRPYLSYWDRAIWGFQILRVDRDRVSSRFARKFAICVSNNTYGLYYFSQERSQRSQCRPTVPNDKS